MQDPDTPTQIMPHPDTSLMEIALHHDLVRWREQLARSIARTNLELHSDGIMAAVNRVLLPLLFLRVAEDRHLVPAGTLARLRHERGIAALMDELAPVADALYSDEAPPLPHRQVPAGSPVLDARVVHGILDVLLAPDRRYDLSRMPGLALARVMGQYLGRTVRRSATHMAAVVDTHDTVLSGTTLVPPDALVEYLVTGALATARSGRKIREVLPLRVFDPACGSGTILLVVYQDLLEGAGGPALTFEERQEILLHSVHGLDLSR
ncbi:MAG: hypothetical protein GYA23_11785, partial [Methanomicrobiales archaeon]|nr:hypothetical protein [Methanomicrobiales archaeon]